MNGRYVCPHPEKCAARDGIFDLECEASFACIEDYSCNGESQRSGEAVEALGATLRNAGLPVAETIKESQVVAPRASLLPLTEVQAMWLRAMGLAR